MLDGGKHESETAQDVFLPRGGQLSHDPLFQLPTEERRREIRFITPVQLSEDTIYPWPVLIISPE